MNFLALLLGLGVERLLTHLFHLREFRWLDSFFDAVFRQLEDSSTAAATIGVLLAGFFLALPVALIAFPLMDELLHIPYFFFAILVLLFSLGPRDLKEEVDDYLDAVEQGDPEILRQLSKELMEKDPPTDPADRTRDVESAIFVQANNRMFGVVFWFVLLGPTGAWLFRVMDLMRRRAAYQLGGETVVPVEQDPDATASSSQYERIAEAVATVHGWLAWVPARLLGVGYALAGRFEEGVAAWREFSYDPTTSFYEVTDRMLAQVGAGAAGRLPPAAEAVPEEAERPRCAMSLVIRTLWLIWCPVIAVLTLYDWLT